MSRRSGRVRCGARLTVRARRTARAGARAAIGWTQGGGTERGRDRCDRAAACQREPAPRRGGAPLPTTRRGAEHGRSGHAIRERMFHVKHSRRRAMASSGGREDAGRGADGGGAGRGQMRARGAARTERDGHVRRGAGGRGVGGWAEGAGSLAPAGRRDTDQSRGGAAPTPSVQKRSAALALGGRGAARGRGGEDGPRPVGAPQRVGGGDPDYQRARKPGGRVAGLRSEGKQGPRRHQAGPRGDHGKSR